MKIGVNRHLTARIIHDVENAEAGTIIVLDTEAERRAAERYRRRACPNKPLVFRLKSEPWYELENN